MDKSPAGFLVRLLAELIEFFLFGLIFSLVLFYLSEAQTLAQFSYGFVVYLITIALPLAILGILYRPTFTHYFGGNIGKLLTGLKVTTRQNSPLTIKAGLFRYTIGYTFSSVLFGLGFWSIIKDKDKLAFHDKAVGSNVVIHQNIWPVGLLILTALILVHILIVNQTLNRISAGPLKSEFGYLILNLDQELKNLEKQKKEKTSSPSASPINVSPPDRIEQF